MTENRTPRNTYEIVWDDDDIDPERIQAEDVFDVAETGFVHFRIRNNGSHDTVFMAASHLIRSVRVIDEDPDQAAFNSITERLQTLFPDEATFNDAVNAALDRLDAEVHAALNELNESRSALLKLLPRRPNAQSTPETDAAA